MEQKLAANSPEKTERESCDTGLPLLVKLIAPEAALVSDELLPRRGSRFRGSRPAIGPERLQSRRT